MPTTSSETDIRQELYDRGFGNITDLPWKWTNPTSSGSIQKTGTIQAPESVPSDAWYIADWTERLVRITVITSDREIWLYVGSMTPDLESFLEENFSREDWIDPDTFLNITRVDPMLIIARMNNPDVDPNG